MVHASIPEVMWMPGICIQGLKCLCSKHCTDRTISRHLAFPFGNCLITWFTFGHSDLWLHGKLVLCLWHYAVDTLLQGQQSKGCILRCLFPHVLFMNFYKPIIHLKITDLAKLINMCEWIFRLLLLYLVGLISEGTALNPVFFIPLVKGMEHCCEPEGYQEFLARIKLNFVINHQNSTHITQTVISSEA